jgi:hypothetical protein
MTTAHADQDADFEAAYAAGVPLTDRRLLYRTLAGNMRMRLVPGERVADVAVTVEHASLTDDARRRGAVRSPGSTAGLAAYLIPNAAVAPRSPTHAGLGRRIRSSSQIAERSSSA